MTEHVFARIAPYGRTMTVTDDAGEEVACKGFLQPVNTLDYDGAELFKAPGVQPDTAYLLLLPPEAVTVGRRAVTVACGGAEYEVLGLQGIFCGETLTHWEGVLREKGGGL